MSVDVMKGEGGEIEVPAKDPLFVPFGCYNDISAIVESDMFYPVLITGPTGAGKTFLVEQACAENGKEMIRVNISIETDEDSLMGGFRLQNGDTVFAVGPVITAMERGATLLLDEIDLASPTRIMCLQSVLEGKGYFLKRIGKWIKPKPGFNIVATANTKGTGDETGSYVGTQILNEAALDRFAITFEHGYPPKEIEAELLTRVFNANKKTSESDKQFRDILVDFANNVRNTVKETQEYSHNISTRRLVHIANTYKVFGDQDRAVRLSLSRFDEHHQEGFYQAYRSLVPMTAEEEARQAELNKANEDPFANVKEWSKP